MIFPVLNCIGNCDQKDLIGIFPTLYDDNTNESTNTLAKYELIMRDINVIEPVGKLSLKDI